MFCAKCWSLVGAHDRACMACGADLTAPGSVRMTDPRRYASPGDRPEVDLSQGEDAVSGKKETTKPKDAEPQADAASQQAAPPVPQAQSPQPPASQQSVTPVPRFLTPEEAATIARIQAESAAKEAADAAAAAEEAADQASAEDQEAPVQQADAEEPGKKDSAQTSKSETRGDGRAPGQKADPAQQGGPGPKNDPDPEDGPTQKHPAQSPVAAEEPAPGNGAISQQTGEPVEQTEGAKPETGQAKGEQAKNQPDGPQPQADGADEPTVVVAEGADEPTHPIEKPAEGTGPSSAKNAVTVKSGKQQVGEPKAAGNSAGKSSAPGDDGTRTASSAPQGQGIGPEQQDGKPADKQTSEPIKVDPVPAAQQNQNIGQQNRDATPPEQGRLGRKRRRNRDRKKAKAIGQGWPAPPPSAAQPVSGTPAVPGTPVPGAPTAPVAASISQPMPAPQAPAAPQPPQAMTPPGSKQPGPAPSNPGQPASPQSSPASPQVPTPQSGEAAKPGNAGQPSEAQNQGAKQQASGPQPATAAADQSSQVSQPAHVGSSPQPAQSTTQAAQSSQTQNPQAAPSPASSQPQPAVSTSTEDSASAEAAKGPGWWGGVKTHISELGAKAAALNAPAVEDDEDAGESFNFWSEVGVYEPSEEEAIAREYDPRRRKALYWLGGGIVFVVLVSILFTLGMFSSERKLYASVTSTSTAELPPNPQPSDEQSQEQPTSTEEPSDEQSASASSTSTPSKLRTPKAMVPGAKQCADGVWSGPNTSCNLATAAAQQIDRSITKPVEISAFSSTTNRNYRLQCTPNEGITCEGLDGVSGVIIYIAA